MKRSLVSLAALLIVAVAGCSSPPDVKSARYAQVSLPGSVFEIDDSSNLIVDDGDPRTDWASVSETRRTDMPSGTGDDSFGQGAKEDTPVPTVVSGSIPPNKSDLLNFGVYLEVRNGKRFLHLFWHRVQEPSGTTNMDFEFNQSHTLSSNGVTPERTPGDLLIQYDLANGGTKPELFLSKWIDGSEGKTAADCEASNKLPCWAARTSLSASGDATGSINTLAIPAAESDGLGDVSPRTFGEASLNFDAVAGQNGSACVSFGSAYLKSRSSDSFTAALKDFIAPQTVNISNCGSIKVLKKDDAGTLLAGASFKLVKDEAPVGGSPGPEDTVVVGTCTTGADGSCSFTGVMQGEYWLIETAAPSGHDPANPPYQHVTLVAGETVTKTFINERHRGAIKVTKTRKHAADGPGDHPHSGVSFTVNGVTKQTGADGTVCFDGLLTGPYTVTETVPAGYKGEAPKSVTVDNKASCSDSPYVGESVSFSNVPLSDITVSFSSQIPGGTAAKISCQGLTASPADATPSAFDDTSETFKNLLPGTYTCTIVVDP